MLPLFFFIAFDSLPPIPAPADLRCPEPAIRFEPDRDYVEAEAYYGRYFVARLTGRRSGFFLDAAYAHDKIWFAGQDGRVKADFALPFKNIWLRPFIDGSWLNRTGDYRRFGAGFEASSDLPWFVLTSGIQYNRWEMSGTISHPSNYHYQETEGYISGYGDRFAVMPQLDFHALYRAGAWYPSLTVRLHAGAFHIGLGSASIRDFPAPRLDIDYLTPRLAAGIFLENGAVHKPLSAYYDPGTPYQYPVPLAAEELKYGIGGRGRYQFGPLTMGADLSFFDWETRLVPSIWEGYQLEPASDMNEVRTDFIISFADKLGPIVLNQTLRFRYDKTDPVIPDEPVYDLADSLSIEYGPVFTVLVARYIHDRVGMDRALPRLLLVDPMIGLRRGPWKIFCAVYNLNDSQREIYEYYRPGSLTIVGGIGLKL
jgi:hypothetical protein